MSVDGPVVLEFGPGVIRRRDGGPAAPGPMSAAALGGIDDPLVLLDERPVAVDDLLRSVIARVVGNRCARIVLVHPSSWPTRRVARVIRAAEPSAGHVAALSRADLAAPGSVVIEIDELLVAVRIGDAVRALDRRDTGTPPAIADIVAQGMPAGAQIILDVPPGLPGAEATAADIRAALARHGLVVEYGDAGDAGPGRLRSKPRIRLQPRLIGIALLCILGVVVGGTQPLRHPPVAPVLTAAVVEGRVAVLVPEGWTVERLVRGPGSRRVRVSSPVDSDDALHITQSYVPDTTLADAGVVLGRVVAAQPAGVFADFRVDARAAGRPAITYREARPPRLIRWTVLLDGSTRISIGCQSRAGAEAGIGTACEQAIRSAHELRGTGPGS